MEIRDAVPSHYKNKHGELRPRDGRVKVVPPGVHRCPICN